MGTVYRQAGRHNWMIKYYRDGRGIVESARTVDKTEAKKLLRQREADVDRGLPLGPRVGKLRFQEAANDIQNEYRANGRRSFDELERRIRLHLQPVFGGRRLVAITTADVRAFTAGRQKAGASNGEINRELTALKRMFSLALQGGKLLHKPHIPMLKENNVRTGFFEREAFEVVRGHLPENLQGMVTFAYITGWRIDSEVLPLEWRRVDATERLSPNQEIPGTVRLDPGTTKNDEGRVFPFTTELREVLEAQRRTTDVLNRAQGRICPWVFHRDGTPIRSFIKTWRTACRDAGQPGKIPHDFRRTAVRNLVRCGVPERVAMKLTGHKTRSVFERYNIVSDGDLGDAARKLDRGRSAKRTNVVAAGTTTTPIH